MSEEEKQICPSCGYPANAGHASDCKVTVGKHESRLFANIEKSQVTPLTEIIDTIEPSQRAFTVEKLCGDADFAEAFIRSVPDKEEQKKFLVHSSKFELGHKDYDSKYVLFFRRTLPSKQPKPEERWSNSYMHIRNGLRVEIPRGPHRYHSIILCDSLDHLLINGKKDVKDDYYDGEIVVNFPEYKQGDSVCSFKPKHEKEELEKYLKTEVALNEDDIARLVTQHKGKESNKKAEVINVPIGDNSNDDVW